MKIIAIIIILLLSLTVSCRKETITDPGPPKQGYTRSDGLILGADARECMCCGGWFVRVNHDTLRIFNMPQGFDSTLITKTMPVMVSLDWKHKTDGCGASMTDLIEVDAIKLK